jgi:glyoxylase-like metal-dependent hydrolase (beta-lactamase superfamily II)
MRRRQFLQGSPFLTMAASAAPARVRRWTIITIGNLSRNRYWGEPDDKPLRDPICTCTLLSGDGFQLLVDPSLANRKDMARELERRTGVTLDAVTALFVTHEHADHWAGVGHFEKAAWYAAAPVAEILNRNSDLGRKFEPAPRNLLGAVEVIPTPGHTSSHHSLRFDHAGRSIVIAGDAVATQDFWRDRRSYYNAVDPAQGARTMNALARMAGLIVPGHDNYFAV